MPQANQVARIEPVITLARLLHEVFPFDPQFPREGDSALAEFRLQGMVGGLAILFGVGRVVVHDQLEDPQEGVAQGGEFRISNTPVDSQCYPVVTGLADGGFAVSWAGKQDGSGYGIISRMYTAAGEGPRFMALVHHDDAEREWAYGAASKIGTFSDALMTEAKQQGWVIISMKNDWKRIFAFEP